LLALMVTRQCEVLHELLFEPLHVTHVHVVQAALQACNLEQLCSYAAVMMIVKPQDAFESSFQPRLSRLPWTWMLGTMS
jgi:nicotinic acid mononucleotide adenylyltransferase